MSRLGEWRHEWRVHRPLVAGSMYDSIWRKPNKWFQESASPYPCTSRVISTLYNGWSPKPLGHHSAGFLNRSCHDAQMSQTNHKSTTSVEREVKPQVASFASAIENRRHDHSIKKITGGREYGMVELPSITISWLVCTWSTMQNSSASSSETFSLTATVTWVELVLTSSVVTHRSASA